MDSISREPERSDLAHNLQNLFNWKALRWAGRPLQRLLGVDKVIALYSSVLADRRDVGVADKILEHLGIDYEASELDRARIPRHGPLIVVANHPFGAAEGLVLASLLSSVRADIRIMANYLLEQIDLPGMREIMIFVNPFEDRSSIKSNIAPLRRALQWVNGGGVLGIFPAGEVSHLQLRRREIVDPAWNDTVARIIRLTKAPVLPVFFEGVNSHLFQILGLIHPRLRTLMLPREMFKRSHKEIRLRVGKPIPFEKLAQVGGDVEVTEYLRLRTYLLGEHRDCARRRAVAKVRKLIRPRVSQPVAGPREFARIPAEVEAIPSDQVLIETEAFLVFHAGCRQIPALLHELGRQREITFRGVGEGTGMPLDLDDFDRHYQHLVLWNKEKRELAGGYRLGMTDEILPKYGSAGLYTSSLFKYAPGFLREISPAIELGRSFVRREYQKSYQPLMLLWKGIGSFISARPRYRILFGPVSISNQYHWISRELIVAFSKSHHRSEFTHYVKGNGRLGKNLPKQFGLKSTCPLVDNLQDLSEIVSCIERNGEGIPILLKHYLKLGGKFLGFTVDRSFSNVMDALIMVDLNKADKVLLERYMGKRGLDDFLMFHECGPLRACA